MTEGIDYRFATTKAKYIDAQMWLIEKWKAARAAAGHSTKTVKPRKSLKPSESTVKDKRLSDASEGLSQRSTQRTQRSQSSMASAAKSATTASTEAASVVSAESAKSKQSLIKKSAKIVKPKVKKVVPPPAPPNPEVTTQEISIGGHL